MAQPMKSRTAGRTLIFALCLCTASAALAQSETDFYDSGSMLMGQKRYAEAEAEFRKSVKADPRYKEAWQALANVLRIEGKLGQAQAAAKIADAAPGARAGNPPPLTDAQKQALGESAATAPITTGVAPSPTPAKIRPAAPAEPQPANAPQTGAAALPIETSQSVRRNAKGMPVVAAPTGRPIEGLKLSRHDIDIYSPSIAVAPDGAIHVAFVEQHAATKVLAVYHRSSSDGGKSWTDAKNLSEVMPAYKVGNCRVVIDGAGRVYVIWHTGVAEGYATDMDAHAGLHNNLVYRVLADGNWSGKAIPIHLLYGVKQQNEATASWFASADPTGRVHVIWNMMPDSRHPEALSQGAHSPAVGAGMVMDAILNGSDPGTAREIFMAKLTPDREVPRWPTCDQLDTLDGLVDAAGQAHFLAKATYVGAGPPSNVIHMQLIEGGKQTSAMELPGRDFDVWVHPPRLLVDARGRRHAIAMFPAGEQPRILDYLMGSGNEPVTIRATKQVSGKLLGFQAYQGPNGRMIAIMQMNDTGNDSDSELYLSTSDGGAWSVPVNVTNNSGMTSFLSTQTSIASHVASYSYWYPGPAAAAYDRQGHLLLIHVSNKRSAMQSAALGWTLAGGSTKTPNLLFLRF